MYVFFTDIDECGSGFYHCDENADCIDIVGSYICDCKEGYTGNGETCSDIDECSSINNLCNENAICSNTNGSYTCKCEKDYFGNGLVCTRKSFHNFVQL